MKIIHVYGDDYAAIEFERYFKGINTNSIIERFFLDGENYDGDFEMELLEFGEIDPKFIQFIKAELLDYDMLKHENFYLEDTIIG